MSGLDEKGRYCTCNSKTNPCIVCGKPKFIDPEWLKRKIEEEPDGMEVGAGFEIFSAPASASVTPADVGEEPVVEALEPPAMMQLRQDNGNPAWMQIEALFNRNNCEVPGWRVRDELVSFFVWAQYGKKAATALERVVRERDKQQRGWESAYALARQLEHELHEANERAESAEAKLAEARKVIERYESGLNTLATTFYKDDQHQDYAKHVLAIRTLEPRHD